MDPQEWIASLSPADREELLDGLDFGLWWFEYHFRDFPADPTPGDKHPDDDGQIWTYIGGAHGWAIVGADRPPRPKCAQCGHVRSAHRGDRCVLCDNGSPAHEFEGEDEP